MDVARKPAGSRYGIIDESAARAVLAPLHDEFFGVIDSAWSRFQAGPATLTQRPSNRYRANAMADLMVDEARQRFGDRTGVRILEGDRFLLNVENCVLVQFKKVDQELLSANYQTPTAVAFDGQRTLPGLPDVSRITIGYQPDVAWSEISSVVVLLRRGRHLMWNYELEQALAETTAVQPLATEVIVKPKRQIALPFAKSAKREE